VTGFSDPSTTRSVDYIAEPLEDTVQVVGGLCDVMVIRHHMAGAARRAANLAGVPVINGGDGSNEHPTQALADAWLMSRRLGSLRGGVVGLVGDPGTRVLRSLVLTLIQMDIGKLLFVVPPNLPISALEYFGAVHTTLPPDLRVVLDNSSINYEFRSDVRELLDEADAVYMMPVNIPALDADPKSLSKRQQSTPERYRVTAAKIKSTRSRSLIMHPGPRSEELHPNVDDLPNGLYFDQVRESVFLRMAVLTRLTDVSTDSWQSTSNEERSSKGMQ
jgi:aspartate carbamoyltransferase catalytic subunit